MTTTIEDDGLRAILAAAEKATPGPWKRVKSEDNALWQSAGLLLNTSTNNLDYLASVDPQTITAIVTELLALRSSPAVDGVGEPVARIANTDGPDRVYWLRPCPPKGTLLYASPTSDRASVVEECAKVVDDLGELLQQQVEALDISREAYAYEIAAKAIRALSPRSS